MKLTMVLLSILAFGTICQVEAQDTSVIKKQEISKVKSYAELITARAIGKTGLFNVYKQDEKYFFEIPDSLLHRDILFTTRLAKVPTGSPLLGGELVNSIIVSFEKAEDKIFVRASTNVAYADSSQANSKAVRNATIDPIIMA